MSNGKGREFKSRNGNGTIIIHSKLMDMTKEERREWYRAEQKAGNPVLKEIAKAVNDCYKKYD
ncbi:hypothetical protein ABEY24_06555 [Peribacillus frigoritolerans]|uniref:hypothetical protein n=1 Tax=Peribacillus frigoritolerans TaxID=450367 RepID=UPI003D2B2A48